MGFILYCYCLYCSCFQCVESRDDLLHSLTLEVCIWNKFLDFWLHFFKKRPLSEPLQQVYEENNKEHFTYLRNSIDR
jgi:hypothetical protein